MINEEIITFVRKTLGCGCPEEVFQHIDFKSGIRAGDILLKGKMNIGNRLLIYIVEMNETESMKRVLTSLVGTGIKERDASNFNRFRLVLASNNCDAVRRSAEAAFLEIQKDEKVHLHVVPEENIPRP
jgi:hypothetical protein